MMKGNLSAALEKLRRRSEQEVEKMEHLPLNFRDVLIDALDEEGLRRLTGCVHLALSTNCIERMPPLPPLANLRVLSLGRNQIKKIAGLEAVGGTLEQLWLSYNLIERLDGLAPHCTALRVLYVGHNKLKDWAELEKVKDLPRLENCSLLGNEFYDKPPPRDAYDKLGAEKGAAKEAEKAGAKEAEKGAAKEAEKAGGREEARLGVLRRLPGLTMLDGVAVDLADHKRLGRA